MSETARYIVGYGAFLTTILVGVWFMIWWAADRDWRVPTVVISLAVGVVTILYAVYALITFWVVNG